MRQRGTGQGGAGPVLRRRPCAPPAARAAPPAPPPAARCSALPHPQGSVCGHTCVHLCAREFVRVFGCVSVHVLGGKGGCVCVRVCERTRAFVQVRNLAPQAIKQCRPALASEQAEGSQGLPRRFSVRCRPRQRTKGGFAEHTAPASGIHSNGQMCTATAGVPPRMHGIAEIPKCILMKCFERLAHKSKQKRCAHVLS